jgi:serine/threonine protein kinase
MSVSIDEDPADEQGGVDEGARSVLASWLDDYAAGRCERADMEESFLSVCSTDSEASWDALALLDQYQRLGRIEAELARDLKSKIAQLAVGAPKQRSGASASRENAPRENDARSSSAASGSAASVSSGTQWRPPAPEKEPESLHTDDIEVRPTSVRGLPPRIKPLPADKPSLRNMRDTTGPPEPAPVDEEDEEQDQEVNDQELNDQELEDDQVVPARPLTRQPSVFADREPTRLPGKRSDPASSQPRRVAPRVEAPSIPAADRRVLRDRYELLSVLARGNSSTVYKALDRHRANLSESARYVAVKVLNANYDGRPEALAQLEREFHQAQSVSHPNIASVFDLDRDGGTYFIVMELLEGQLLSNVLRRLSNSPMARKYALALIGSVGAALAHAHRRDVIHGDLKPRNIMITSMGEVRVLEFGFARSRPQQSGEVDEAHDAVSIGTPAYASAERVHGVDPDPSDDVYSLACIAYELLSGRHPYGGRSAFLARAHGRRPQRIAGLTHRQWHALQRALAWDRADRKIDVADLLIALGAADATHELVPPELLSIPDSGRGRRIRAWSLATALVLAIALVVYWVTTIPPPVQTVDVTTAVPQAAPSDSEMMDSSSADKTVEAPRPSADASSNNVPPAKTSANAPPPAAAPPDAAKSPTASEDAATTQSAPNAAAASTRAGTIQFEKDTYVVTESEAVVTLQVVRTGSLRGALTFRWTLQGNSAEAGADYAGIGPGVEQIPSGARTATVSIPLVKDGVTENTELFLVELEAVGQGVTLGELAHAAVIVVDDD